MSDQQLSNKLIDQSNNTEDLENAVLKVSRPWLWRKGQSGNPKGRPPGRSVKDRAKAMLATMTDEEFEDFLHGMDKKIIWEMAEGKAKQDVDIKGHLTISDVLDQLDGQTTTGQELEAESSVQDQKQEGAVDPVQTQPSATGLPPEEVVSQPDSKE